MSIYYNNNILYIVYVCICILCFILHFTDDCIFISF